MSTDWCVPWCHLSQDIKFLFKTFFQDIQVRVEHDQNRISDMSFGGPYTMASHCLYVCIRPRWRRLFTLGIPPRCNIFCDGKHSLSSFWISLTLAIYRWSPLIVSSTLQTKHCSSVDPRSGLLLLRTWVFTGKSTLLAYILSILFSGYAASTVWVNVLYMGLYKGARPESPEACLESLTVARHRIGVGVFHLPLICPADHDGPSVRPSKNISTAPPFFGK